MTSSLDDTGQLALQALIAARRVADFASAEGATSVAAIERPMSNHMGAIIADAVLQAGVSYAAVVFPRVSAILRKFPEAERISSLAELVEHGRTGAFLNWEHFEKIQRFDCLVQFLRTRNIECVQDLRARLLHPQFGEELQTIKGIGPKTVDYLACLVGIDSVAIDRHVRTFARRAGVQNGDYKFLRTVFCCAADLLSLSRRDFDAWVWRNQTSVGTSQLHLAL